jgi:hypothetical protein
VYRLEKLQNLDLTADQRMALEQALALAYIARELETARMERLSAGKLKTKA